MGVKGVRRLQCFLSMRYICNFFLAFDKFCNVFVPFGNSCNSFIMSGSFFGVTLSMGVEKSRLASSFLLSDSLSSSTRASKSSIFEMQEEALKRNQCLVVVLFLTFQKQITYNYL